MSTVLVCHSGSIIIYVKIWCIRFVSTLTQTLLTNFTILDTNADYSYFYWSILYNLYSCPCPLPRTKHFYLVQNFCSKTFYDSFFKLLSCVVCCSFIANTGKFFKVQFLFTYSGLWIISSFHSTKLQHQLSRKCDFIASIIWFLSFFILRSIGFGILSPSTFNFAIQNSTSNMFLFWKQLCSPHKDQKP